MEGWGLHCSTQGCCKGKLERILTAITGHEETHTRSEIHHLPFSQSLHLCRCRSHSVLFLYFLSNFAMCRCKNDAARTYRIPLEIAGGSIMKNGREKMNYTGKTYREIWKNRHVRKKQADNAVWQLTRQVHSKVCTMVKSFSHWNWASGPCG